MLIGCNLGMVLAGCGRLPLVPARLAKPVFLFWCNIAMVGGMLLLSLFPSATGHGLTVLAIWRKGNAHHSDLRHMALEFGDALMLYGSWEKLRMLGREPDFIVLTKTAQEVPREEKAATALAIMFFAVRAPL